MKIEITRRPVFGRGRTRYVYDAEGSVDGIDYCVAAAPSKADARQQALAQVAFNRRNNGIAVLGFQLYPNGVESFVLVLARGGSHIFGAPSLRAAFLRVASDYQDHPGVQSFISAVLAEGLRAAAHQ